VVVSESSLGPSLEGSFRITDFRVKRNGVRVLEIKLESESVNAGDPFIQKLLVAQLEDRPLDGILTIHDWMETFGVKQ